MDQWKPFKKQEIALLSNCFETLYGGARGGGKTDAGIAKVLYWKDNPKFRALVIRKNYTDLKDWRDRALRMYQSSGGRSSEGDIVFPSGAKVVLGHLKDANAYIKYQGHEYHYMLIEELTQVPSEELYLKLVSSCRSTESDLKPQVFCTSNPGGVGHSWVKKRFIDPASHGEVFNDPDSGRTRVFIPATVDDNPVLQENDPDYVKFLESLPPDLKAQWRYGSWANQRVKGAIFLDDVRQAQAENRVSKLSILEHLPVLTAWDLGINNLQVVWFYQVRGDEIRVIDCEQGDNMKFTDWIKVLADKDYRYGTVVLPHDGNKRSPDSLRSFRNYLEEADYTVRIIARTKDKTRDIQIARSLFPRCKFDEEKCSEGLDALSQHRREWDEEKQTYRRTPLHDWTSNYADAFEAMAVSLIEDKPKDDYDEAVQDFINPKPVIRPQASGIIAKPSQDFYEEQREMLEFVNSGK